MAGPGFRGSGDHIRWDADRPVLTWSDCAELWTLLALNPSSSNRQAKRQIVAALCAAWGTDSLTLEQVMSMYDREPNFEDTFKVGDRFVLMNLEHSGTIQTRVGPAEKVLVTLVTRDSYPKSETYSALGVGFAAQAKRATRGDFPHVAEYVRVRMPSGNEVKRFAAVDVSPTDWRQGEDGPPIEPMDAIVTENGSGSEPATDPGF